MLGLPSPPHRLAFFAMRKHWQQLKQAAQLSAESSVLPSKTYKPWMLTAASVLLAGRHPVPVLPQTKGCAVCRCGDRH